MKREINPEHVVEMLQRRGYILFPEGSDDILYGLDRPLPSATSFTHYPASLENLP
jgi:hypothetical protein